MVEMKLPRSNFYTHDFREIPVEEFKAHWPDFSPAELACKGSGSLRINILFMDKLQELRNVLDKPVILTSGYRSPQHNERVSKGKKADGPHVRAKAADIVVRNGGQAYTLVKAALDLGFTGIGINLAEGFIHIDTCFHLEEDFLRPGERPFIWTY